MTSPANNFTTEVNKSEQDHDENSSVAGDLRTPAKKIIPAIGDYSKTFLKGGYKRMAPPIVLE